MKAIVAILSAALVALGGSAIHLWRQLDASRRQIADLKAKMDTPTAFAHQAAVTAAAPSPSLTLVEPTVATPTAAPIPDGVRKEMEMLAAARANLQSPEINAQVKAVMVGSMPNEYPDVGKVLGLSRGEVDKLFSLLFDQSYRSSTVDVRGTDAALQAHLKQTAKDELSSLLGSKYAKWEEYRTELPTRRGVKDLTVALEAAGMPLTEAQNNSLIQALVAEERRNSQFGVATPTQTSGIPSIPAQFNRFTPEANRNRLSAGAGNLTPQQMETYSQVLERASAREAATRTRMLDAQKSAEAARQGQR